MSSNILRVAAASPRVTVGRPAENAAETSRILEHLADFRPDVAVFPELSLTGATCGSLFNQNQLLNDARLALEGLVRESEGFDFAIIVSLPVRLGGQITAVAAVIHSGRLIALVPSETVRAPLSAYLGVCGERRVPVVRNAVFRYADGATFSVLPSPDLAAMPLREAALKAAGCDVVLSPVALPALGGADIKGLAAARADMCGAALLLCGAGAGESTSEFVFRGFAAVAEPRGMSELSCQAGLDSHYRVWDLDLDIVRSAAPVASPADISVFELPVSCPVRDELMRPISRVPYLPDTFAGRLERFNELFELQKLSLCGRLSGTGLHKVVIGVSGGLDSTLALLVAADALEMMGLPPENLIAVTMPGFGTTNRTYTNAVTLIRQLGAAFREISIAASVTLHFADIGHDETVHNSTYENAQARERTQILFDIANSEGALVLGTGDLSEIALGWCTFGGDHLAGYGVNSCLTKGMIRGIVDSCAAVTLSEELRAALKDILDTPVSPELLPGGANTQSTESILGPYELHDFFLYHTVKFGFSSDKLLLYAKEAFPEIDQGELERHLATFHKKFIAGQFKRACATESAAITDFSIHSYSFPSDMPSPF